jgi:squalene-hopene/tetraprenyl-beta-curcumene cyclase
MWEPQVPAALAKKLNAGIRNGVRYLRKTQRADGSWLPLWFGNQHAPDDENPTYGTAKVVLALAELSERWNPAVETALARGVNWLLARQRADGAWGGGPDSPASLEETALAVEALAATLAHGKLTNATEVKARTLSGAAWLAKQIMQGHWHEPSPIGFYFAKLWYYEKLYPLVFAAGAMERVRGLQKSGSS